MVMMTIDIFPRHASAAQPPASLRRPLSAPHVSGLQPRGPTRRGPPPRALPCDTPASPDPPRHDASSHLFIHFLLLVSLGCEGFYIVHGHTDSKYVVVPDSSHMHHLALGNMTKTPKANSPSRMPSAFADDDE
jgi:hypothetical protein